MFQEKLEEILNDIIRQGGTEIGAAIYYKGRPAAAGAAGSQDVQAEIGDRFNVGSVSKVYCAAAVMKLAEEKKITLDTEVCQVLPRFHMADSRYVDITFRMCLNHSSGLPGTGMKLAFQTEFLYDEFKEAFFEYLSYGRLKADPGSFSVYCNDGFDLAAFAIEAITGEPYISYLRRAILDPIGAKSTGCGTEALPGKLVREKGSLIEYLACVGSGGIVTNLDDCARFGALFSADHTDVLSAESMRELTSPQGKTNTGNSHSLNFGLGWDRVSSSGSGWNFGSDALGKSGGTSQFASYLLVCPKYQLSAAVSATKDTGIVPLEIISQIAAAFLESEGVALSRKSVLPENEKSEVIDGLYFGNRGLYRIATSEKDFCIDEFTPAGWKSFAESTDGFSFNQRKGAVDLMMKWHGDNLVLAEKFQDKDAEAIDKETAWEQRIGKSYLICNGHPSDLDIGDMINGVKLYRPDGAETEFEKKIILFCGKETEGFRMMPAMAVDDDTTAYVLDGEGSPGCRDTFTPFIEIEQEGEILYDGGVRYRDTASLPKLISGTVKSQEPQKNPLFRTDADCCITVYKPQHVKILLYDEDLQIYYDERRDSTFPLTKKGYAVFLNREPFSARVSCEKVGETGENNEF